MEQDSTGDDNTATIETGIHTLPNELLLLIFEMNADMFFNINALKDTHHASLVSQRWRQILVDSPSIWGKLIDLNVLCKDSKVKEDWVNEILRRSEGALLWIRVSISKRQNQSRAWTFFESLIKNNWTRIQKLVVNIVPLSMDDRSTSWQTILQPAPNLETFKVRCYHDSFRDGLDFNFAMKFVSEDHLLFHSPRDHPLDLFFNHAPSLREFVATQIYFSLSAPWLSNLRSVFFTSPITLHKTFQAIEQMPLPERLDLKGILYPPDQPDLPHLNFPKLTAIALSDFLCVCSRVLNHITPAQGCSLSLSVVKDAFDRLHNRLTSPVLRDTHQALSKYLKLFYQSHAATRIALCCSSEAFSFTDTTTRFGENPPFSTVNFAFGPMSFYDDNELTAFNDLVLAFTFDPASFPRVLTLDLDAPILSYYTSFLSLSDFSAIEVLQAHESSLTTILELADQKLDPNSRSCSYPFPSLETLRLTGVNPPQSGNKARNSPLSLFLKASRRHGFPIKVLEVYSATPHPRLGYLRPFGRVLDRQLAGMMVKVLSQDGDGREVVCGGGNAYRLFLEY
ncbi:hypothetical protein GALMADRAFT_237343 [Galerina marginata CBS 339.88]|uniref:F-box domain-containing protein n=1 Tax=Galerina marginata (strain CBS 339.88) TaxID=685588 RepID=A0A067TZJ1_GALM3|nr:hypothetical protein GALMADRAFT_237343 [Galerina marginata CBS 339.88]